MGTKLAPETSLNLHSLKGLPAHENISLNKKAKPSLPTPRRHTGGAEVKLHSLSTSALDKDHCSILHPSGFTLGKGDRALEVYGERKYFGFWCTVYRFGVQCIDLVCSVSI
jgi:hypothetical protein